MDNLNKFYKITIQDKDIGCYNMKPFDFTELNDTTELSDGTPITNTMKNRAINSFKSISRNTTNASKCCDPTDILTNPGEFTIFTDFVNQYPKYRNINESGTGSSIKHIELTTDVNKSGSGWTNMDAITFCRINKALNNNSLIKQTEDRTVFKVDELLGDCPTEACNPDRFHSVEDLFTGTITATGESKSSRVQDKEIYFGMKNKSLASLVNYIKEFNDVNRLINYQNNKYRLLHLAAEFYSEEVMNAIIAMKPELDLKDGFGNTALHVAVKNNNYYAVEKLLDAGASKDIKDKNGMTPIMSALLLKSDDKIFNNYTYITLLHNSGAGLFNTDNDGNTMLHIAVANDIDNVINVVNYLIDNGMETNVKNKFNKTALQIVNEKVAELDIPTAGKIKVDRLSKKEAGLLTAQTLIFNSIIRNNPGEYSEFINLEDLNDDIPLVEVLKSVCVGGTNVIGNENQDECVAKGGDYKLLQNSNKIRVKFDLDSISNIDNITEDGLYLPKFDRSTYIENDPLISRINKNALDSLMVTSTEDSHSGEYISRDIIYNSNGEIATPTTTNNTDNAVEEFKELDSMVKSNEMNILEGFNNSANYLTKQNRKDILVIILTICLLIIFIIFLYKLTV